MQRTWVVGPEIQEGYKTFYLNPELFPGVHGLMIGKIPQITNDLIAHLLNEDGHIMVSAEDRLICLQFPSEYLTPESVLAGFGYVAGEVV